VSQIVFPLACLLALHMIARLYRGPICVQCRGRGKHREGCPFDKSKP